MSRSLYWSATRSVPRMSVFDALRAEGMRLDGAIHRGIKSWRSLMPYIVQAPPQGASVLRFDGPALTDAQLAELKRQVQQLAVTAR